MNPAHEPVDPAWLSVFLSRALANKWCTKIYCTTCGARDFRQGLRDALTVASGKAPPPIQFATYSKADAEILARALAVVTREDFAGPSAEDAMQMIIHEIDSSVGAAFMQGRIAELLGRSWAGGTLACMYAHAEWDRERRRVHADFNDPETVKKRQAEKRRLKAEAHAARLEAKKERDRLWRERNPGG